jgi:hypothetical protein
MAWRGDEVEWVRANRHRRERALILQTQGVLACDGEGGGLRGQSRSTMAMAPHCSQELHMVRERPGPAAHAMRSFGSCVQFALSRQTVSSSSERAYMLLCAAYMREGDVAHL